MLKTKKKFILEGNVSPALRKKIKIEFNDFILGKDHPCLMAQTVFSMNQVDLRVYENFGSRITAQKILADIKEYLLRYDFESNDFLTFIAVFNGKREFTECQFEKKLWQQLQLIYEEDDRDWDETVQRDPENENFSFSVGGKAFYVVGMHPGSSRIARQSPYPALTFNLHWQFEKLRNMKTFETVRDKIRERDRKLQGDNNPMLEDFGKKSEARQYSGRKVGEEWKCPFLSTKL